jgi:hypothetical protein
MLSLIQAFELISDFLTGGFLLALGQSECQ